MTIIISITAIVLIYICVPLGHKLYCKKRLRQTVINRSSIALTFDDGPGNRLTPALLDILAEYKVKATFFILGRHVAGREEVVRRIAAEGHQIGVHGYDHLHYWKILPWRALADMKRGYQVIDDVLGGEKKVTHFGLLMALRIFLCLAYAMIRRAPVVYWTVETGDTWPVETRDSQHGVSQVREAGGAVVLAHDNDRVRPETEKFVLDVTRAILTMAKENNMQVVTIEQLHQ